MSNITVRDLMDSGVHFGHSTRYWNPQMAPYIYGKRDYIHIIDLDRTATLAKRAADYVKSLAERNGKLLFVGTKRAAQEIISREALRCGMPFVDHRWLGGMLTNYKTVRQSIKRLKDLEQMKADGVFEKMIKKEALQMERELAKLNRSMGGIKDMGGLPDAIFVVDVGYEKIAVQEANKLKIPVIGIVDTNHSPKDIDYVIPGNDDSMSSIGLFAKTFADIMLTAKPATPAKAEKVAVKTVKKAEASVEAAASADEAAAQPASPEADNKQAN